MQKSKLALFAAALALAVAAPTRAGELAIGIVDPIGKVGPIGKVEPISGDAISRPVATGVRPVGENKYVACWTWNMVKEPKWRCTEQYGDPKAVYEFAEYQNLRYKDGQAVFIAVDRKVWDDPEGRKVVMERFQKEAIPAALERAAGKAEPINPEMAGLLRKQIKFVQPEWVDVKPELPKGVKPKDAVESKKVGYDDDAIVPKKAEKMDKLTQEFVVGKWQYKNIPKDTTTWTLEKGGKGGKTESDGTYPLTWELSSGDSPKHVFLKIHYGGGGGKPLYRNEVFELKDGELTNYQPLTKK